MDGALRYSILDPSGNITALVESPCAVPDQPAVAARIMGAHPEVEQVGFVRLDGAEGGVRAELRMAGGEFCGNASMSAAALYAIRTGCAAEEQTVVLRVSGADEPVEVKLAPSADGGFDGEVRMPRALEIESVELSCGGLAGVLPVIRFSGISHAVVCEDSPFFTLLADRAAAERAVRAWCDELQADGLGLMFVQDTASETILTPLVYIPGSGTVFWEGSCASGSSAAALLLSSWRGAPMDVVFHEPAGTLRVSSDAATGGIRLFGHVALLDSLLA